MPQPTREQMRERDALAQFGLKRCSTCAGVKPRVNFAKLNRAWDGLQSKCKDCGTRYRDAHKGAIAERNRKYREQNREALNEQKRQYLQTPEGRASSRQYREQNREAVKEYQCQYREANREALREQQRQYREANREAILEQRRQYREQNREALAEKQREYYAANREAALDYRRRYREANPNSYRDWSQSPEGKAVRRKSSRKRRALKAAVNERFTAEDEAFVRARDNNECQHCGMTESQHQNKWGHSLHLDHVRPLSKGYALTRTNCQLLCLSCNSRKKDR